MKSAPNIGGTRRVGSYSYGPTAGQQGSSSSREDPLAEAVRLNNAHNVVNRIDGVPVITRWRILSQVDRRLMQPQHQIGDADDSRRSVRHKFRIMDISDVDGMPLLPSKIPPHFSSCHRLHAVGVSRTRTSAVEAGSRPDHLAQRADA